MELDFGGGKLQNSNLNLLGSGQIEFGLNLLFQFKKSKRSQLPCLACEHATCLNIEYTSSIFVRRTRNSASFGNSLYKPTKIEINCNFIKLINSNLGFSVTTKHLECSIPSNAYNIPCYLIHMVRIPATLTFPPLWSWNQTLYEGSVMDLLDKIERHNNIPVTQHNWIKLHNLEQCLCNIFAISHYCK
jgi:hypothetical protein